MLLRRCVSPRRASRLLHSTAALNEDRCIQYSSVFVYPYTFILLHANRFILRCLLPVQWNAADPRPLFASAIGLGRSEGSTCRDATRRYVGTLCSSYKARPTMTGRSTKSWWGMLSGRWRHGVRIRWMCRTSSAPTSQTSAAFTRSSTMANTVY